MSWPLKVQPSPASWRSSLHAASDCISVEQVLLVKTGRLISGNLIETYTLGQNTKYIGRVCPMNIMNKGFHFPMKMVILRTLVETTPQDRSRNILLILTYLSRKKSTKATKTDSDLICFLLYYFKLNYITSEHLV